MTNVASIFGPVVLHIEDDAELGGLVSRSFMERGINTILQRTLRDSLEYLRGTDRLPDVILLDLGLPDSHGLATLVAIVHEAMGIPIVVFTGQDADEGDIETIRRGSADYLVKGAVDLRDLAKLVEGLADGRTAPEFIDRSNSQVIQMVERVRDVMEG